MVGALATDRSRLAGEAPPVGSLIRCHKCGTSYHWEKSGSKYLKMTYCGVICEIADNGRTIENLLLVLDHMLEARRAVGL